MLFRSPQISYLKGKAKGCQHSQGSESKEAVNVYLHLIHMENMNSLASYVGASRNSES